MEYNKPELVVLAPAAEAIQSGNVNKDQPPLDSHQNSSVAAYEADE